MFKIPPIFWPDLVVTKQKKKKFTPKTVLIREVCVSRVALRIRLSGVDHLKMSIRHHCGVSVVLRNRGVSENTGVFLTIKMEVDSYKKCTSPTKSVMLHKSEPLIT